MEFEKNIDYIPDEQNGEVVYFIYDFNSKITKIGISGRNVKWRFSDIKSLNPNITLLFTINRGDYSSVERNLHVYFSKKNYYNEWFSLGKNDFIYIMKKYKDNIKRYKIDDLMNELNITNIDIENYIIVEKEQTSKVKKCKQCSKLLRSPEKEYCKQCRLNIIAEKKMKEQRLMFNRNIENMAF